MIADPKELLGEAIELATKLVDQIEFVDLIHDVATAHLERAQEAGLHPDAEPFVVIGGNLRRDMTAWVSSPRVRERLKRVIESLRPRFLVDPMALKGLPCEEVEAAGELVKIAIRGLAMSTGNGFVKYKRLVIKFRTVDAPWVQPPNGLGIVSPN